MEPILSGGNMLDQKPSYKNLEKRIRLLEQEAIACKRIESKLKASEQRFKDIADNALEWIWEIDSKGRYIYSSPVVNKILGYGSKEILGKYFYDFFHPEDRAKLKDLAFKAFKGHIAFRQFINRNVSKDGETVILSTSGIPLLNKKGELLGYRGADTDVTQQYNVLKALEEKEENLASLLESASGFAIYQLVFDEHAPNSLRVNLVSQSFKDILGIPEPYKFEKWFDFLHPDDVERIRKANAQAFETRKFNEVYRWYNPERKKWRWIHSISTGGSNGEGWNNYVNGILIDITEKQDVFEKLKIREKELESKTKELKPMNSALNVLVKKRDQDKIDMEENISANLKQLILPYLSKIRQRNLNDEQQTLLDIINSNLKEITDSFSYQLTSKFIGLTPTEIKVADLIRQGQKTKQIAQLLCLSTKTIESHRENIRRKLDIKNKKINLRSYLLAN